jgi:serralysin
MKHTFSWSIAVVAAIAMLALGVVLGRVARPSGTEAPEADTPVTDPEALRDLPGIEYPGPCAGLVDGDGGAPVDGLVDSWWRFRYDGRALQHVDTDYGADGEIEARLSFERDDEGRVRGERYDCNADGVPEELFSYVFDRNGRRRLAVLSADHDHADTCFNDEHQQRMDHPDGAFAHPTGPIDVDWSAELAALGAGHLLDDGVRHGFVRYGWRDNEVATEEWDMDGDGRVEEVIRFVHDPWGNLRSETHDDGPDGRVDVSVRYTYDCWVDHVTPGKGPCGGWWDLDLDGEPDAFTTYVRDLDGRTVRMTADWDDDGAIDNHFHYTYDDDGRRRTEAWDTRLDGSRDEILTIHHDGDRRSHGDVDAGGDGTVDGRATYAYDSRGRLLEERWDKDGDGVEDEVLTYRYDARDRLIGAVYDDLRDEQPDETVTFVYECPIPGVE